MIDLAKMKSGDQGIITEFLGSAEDKQKLLGIGIRVGKLVRKISEESRNPVVVEAGNTTIAIGANLAKLVVLEPKQTRILLIGNPNVGKSAVFSRLTGLNVISSNYPGTTVEYLQGTAKIDTLRVQLVDVPGTYSLKPSNKAEEVAAEMLEKEKTDLVIDVIDATNLERNLYLALQLLEKGIPTVLLLNKWDMAQQKGISIDIPELSKKIGVRLIPFVAVTGEGLKELMCAVKEILDAGYTPPGHIPQSDDEKWQFIGEISRHFQKTVHRHPTFLEKLALASIHPWTGFPIALVTLAATFALIRFFGESLITYALDPLFTTFYMPFIDNAVRTVFPSAFVHNLLLGTTPQVMQSFGILTTGVYIPLVIVLPYVVSFYLVLGFLEDLGYLPRLSVLMDTILHRFGLHGFAAIPLLLGFGCKVPAMLSVRSLETSREKIIAMALIIMVAPCIPQSAMIISILSPFGLKYVLAVFGIIFAVSLACGLALNRALKGEAPEFFCEIPPYQMPRAWPLFSKLWVRTRGFFTEAVPMIVLGVLAVNLLDISGALGYLSRAFGTVISNVLGLPGEIATVMVLGFLRKDVSIALLYPFALSAKQLVIACVFLVLYLPCLATFFVLLKEMGIKNTLRILLLTLSSAVLAGALLNILL